MKRSIFYQVAFFLMGVILFGSCSENNISGLKLVPHDAVLVYELDAEKCVSLLSESQTNEITNLLDEFLRNTNLEEDIKVEIKNIMSNPQRIGVKISDPLYVSATLTSEGKEDVYFTGSLSNVNDFEQFF